MYNIYIYIHVKYQFSLAVSTSKLARYWYKPPKKIGAKATELRGKEKAKNNETVTDAKVSPVEKKGYGNLT